MFAPTRVTHKVTARVFVSIFQTPKVGTPDDSLPMKKTNARSAVKNKLRKKQVSNEYFRLASNEKSYSERALTVGGIAGELVATINWSSTTEGMPEECLIANKFERRRPESSEVLKKKYPPSPGVSVHLTILRPAKIFVS